MSGPTKSALAERARIKSLFEAAAMEVGMLMLCNGLPGSTKHQRAKNAATIEGFQKAVDCLKKALEVPA